MEADMTSASASTKSRSRKQQDLAPPSEVSPEERVVFDGFLARYLAQAPAPRVKVGGDSGTSWSVDHPDRVVGTGLLMASLGTMDQDFFGGLMGQLANAGSKGPLLDESGLNFMLAVVKGIGPKDQIEAMLASQMAAVHMATM